MKLPIALIALALVAAPALAERYVEDKGVFGLPDD
jgi:hypothetical protein